MMDANKKWKEIYDEIKELSAPVAVDTLNKMKDDGRIVGYTQSIFQGKMLFDVQFKDEEGKNFFGTVGI